MDTRKLDRWLGSHSNINSTNQLPKGVYSEKELILDIFLSVHLLMRKTEFPCNKLLSSIPRGIFSTSVENFILDCISNLNFDNIDQNHFQFIWDNKEELLHNDLLGTWLQHSLSSENRKISASNYTNSADDIYDSLDLSLHHVTSVMDPFCGSSRLITSLLNRAENIENIIINDVSPTAVLISLCRLDLLVKNTRIYATIGDAFAMKPIKTDLLVMNPPFTRSMRIPKSTRVNITKMDVKIGHEGMHMYAMMLADKMIDTGGILISILPASTLTSSYSKKIQLMLINDYHKIIVGQDSSSLAFSQDSDFNEIFIFCKKGKESDKVIFTDIGNHSTLEVEKNKLVKDWNWIRYFRDRDLLEQKELIHQLFHLKTGGEIKLGVKRGIELYGADFFFFPNKLFGIDDTGEEMLISGEQTYSIKKSFFVKIVRQPKLYHKDISPNINEYALVIPEGTIISDYSSLMRYAEDNSSSAIFAKKRFEMDWLNHTYKQITSKNPCGNLFVIDKLDVNSVSTLVHYLDEPYLCTKNFYVIQLDSLRSKLFAAWMSSSFYLTLYLTSRREINGSYGRLQIIDYKNEAMFPSFLTKIDLTDVAVERILDAFDKLRKQPLLILKHQLGSKDKINLDKAFIEMIDNTINLEDLYGVLKHYLDQL